MLAAAPGTCAAQGHPPVGGGGGGEGRGGGGGCLLQNLNPHHHYRKQTHWDDALKSQIPRPSGWFLL